MTTRSGGAKVATVLLVDDKSKLLSAPPLETASTDMEPVPVLPLSAFVQRVVRGGASVRALVDGCTRSCRVCEGTPRISFALKVAP